MEYISPKRKVLFFIRIATIILGIWLLWMGADTYLLTRNPLAHIQSQKAIAMAVVAVLLFVLLLGGLVLSTMIGNKRYSRYFSIFIGLLFVALLAVRSMFG